MMLEEGLLSGVVSEVLIGIQETQPLPTVEHRSPTFREAAPAEDEYMLKERQQSKKRKLNEQRRQMLDAIGKDAYNGVDLFEGTTPISRAGSPGTAASPSGPLSDMDPGDPGVDISSLFGASAAWKKLV